MTNTPDLVVETRPDSNKPTGHSHDFSVPVQTRSERLRSTNPEDFPAISNREEQWRYTSAEQLGELVSDDLVEFAGDINLKAPDTVQTSWVDSNHPLFGAAGIPEDLPSALAWRAAKAAYLVEIHAGDGHQFINLDLSSTDAAGGAIHLIVHAASHVDATIVISRSGSAQLAENLEIILEPEAKLTFVNIQDFDSASIFNSAQHCKIGRSAALKHITVALGAKLSRISPNAWFAGPGAEVALFGAYFADSGQQLEHRLYVDHAEPNCKSRVTYKGALQGQGARTIWVGDVLIRATATGTDTYELNRNLLLSDGARADSVPNLEIETGQIEGAGHASASGRFDDEQLFYLQARGIPETLARKLVVRGFLIDIVQQIDEPELVERLTQRIEAELERSVS